MDEDNYIDWMTYRENQPINYEYSNVTSERFNSL